MVLCPNLSKRLHLDSKLCRRGGSHFLCVMHGFWARLLKIHLSSANNLSLQWKWKALRGHLVSGFIDMNSFGWNACVSPSRNAYCVLGLTCESLPLNHHRTEWGTKLHKGNSTTVCDWHAEQQTDNSHVSAGKCYVSQAHGICTHSYANDTFIHSTILQFGDWFAPRLRQPSPHGHPVSWWTGESAPLDLVV